MGAHDCIEAFSGNLSREQLKVAVKHAVEDAQYDNGHDPYNGTISTMHGSIQFVECEAANENAACNYILDRHQKWSGPMAMKVKNGPWMVGGWAAG